LEKNIIIKETLASKLKLIAKAVNTAERENSVIILLFRMSLRHA
jgi:hypothetical protein